MKEIILQKQNEVQELTAQLKKADSFVLFEYKGLSAKAFANLRREIHEAGGLVLVAKNNIYNRAVKEAGYKEFPVVENQVAIVLSGQDAIAPFKALDKLINQFEFVKYVNGALESKLVSKGDFVKLANLPGREELYSMFLSCLQGSIRNLAYGLQAVADTKN
ncbi:MAG: 50S ribosomal protein L10 [Mycoplasmataceae bacterium]|jgi:large subunit ribosomal protein L10|nr:50S ribosomal protein L10 [Mycoplasmataceae bacterium]